MPLTALEDRHADRAGCLVHTRGKAKQRHSIIPTMLPVDQLDDLDISFFLSEKLARSRSSDPWNKLELTSRHPSVGLGPLRGVVFCPSPASELWHVSKPRGKSLVVAKIRRHDTTGLLLARTVHCLWHQWRVVSLSRFLGWVGRAELNRTAKRMLTPSKCRCHFPLPPLENGGDAHASLSRKKLLLAKQGFRQCVVYPSFFRFYVRTVFSLSVVTSTS